MHDYCLLQNRRRGSQVWFSSCGCSVSRNKEVEGYRQAGKADNKQIYFVLCEILTAQALVAPMSSNTAPRSQVIRDRVIAVTTRRH